MSGPQRKGNLSNGRKLMCVTIKKIVKFKISLKKTDANSFFFENRFKCGLGCGVEFASKSYSGVRIHAHDFPTKAFLSSGWRPNSKTWLAENDFFWRTETIEGFEECVCHDPLKTGPCKAVHTVE